MSVSLPKSNLHLEGSGRDTNGNRVVKLSLPSMTRAFSIQTAGNMPKTHRILQGLTPKDIEKLSQSKLVEISSEASGYIKKYGSAVQKNKLKCY